MNAEPRVLSSVGRNICEHVGVVEGVAVEAGVCAQPAKNVGYLYRARQS